MRLFSGRGKRADATPNKVMVIGLDLGTSGVKVAVREATDSKRPPAVIDFGTRTSGYSRFSVPSSVWVKGDRILAGDDAEEAAACGSGTVIRSAKMCLLRGMQASGTLIGGFGGVLPIHAAPVATEDEFALAFLLASVVRRVHIILDKNGCGPKDAKLLYNLDIPVDQVADDDVARRFLRTLDAGVHMSGSELDKAGLRTALSSWWECVREWNPNAIHSDERTRNLVAEAHCILAGIGDAVTLKRNTPYAVIDIGAGTTDVGIFRLSQWHDEEFINFFSAATAQVGCDELDRNLASSLSVHAKDRDTVIGLIRNVKEILAIGRDAPLHVNGTKYLVPARSFPAAVREIGAKCNRHYITMWRQAYAKDPNQASWSCMTLLLVGGGALLPGIKEPLCDVPTSLKKFIDNQKVEPVGKGRPCDVWGHSSVVATPTENMLLVAARGLTYTAVQLKQLVHPWEIAGMAAPGRRGSSSETVFVRPERRP